MYQVHAFFVLALFLLVFRRETFLASFVFLFSYLIYFSVCFLSAVPDDYYYHFSALISFIICISLCYKYLVVAFLSCVNVGVNYYGFMLYESYQEPVSYNELFLMITFIQILLLSLRAFNGVIRSDIRHIMVRTPDNDSSKKNKEVLS